MTNVQQVAITSQHPDPLTAVGIKITVEEYLAIYRVSHTFRNSEENAIEAVFTFPVPYGAVLIGVEAELAGKVLSSIAMAKRDAVNRYEDSVASGDTAVLVEEVSPGLYCVNLGNLAPGESANLVFSFGQLLEWRDDGIALRIPTTIAPRYGLPMMQDHQVPVVAFDAVHRAELEVLIRSGVTNWQVSSPTHRLDVRSESNDLLVRPADGTVTMDRDIVIRLMGGQFRPTAMLAKDGDRYLLAATFQPRPERHHVGKARVFKILIDCSGSMQGDSIHQARLGLSAILKALGPDDYFSITRFGSSVDPITQGVIRASGDIVQRYSLRTENIEANLGGTEMRKALINTFAQPWSPEWADEADVILITDGETWNDDGIVAVARASHHRVFTIGVGAAAAEHLLRALAEETGGACEIVTPREGMAERVLRQFERMDARRLTAHLSWPEGAQQIHPEELGSVFAGESVHAFAWFDHQPCGEIAFTAKAGRDVVDSQVLSQYQSLPEVTAGPVAAIAAFELLGKLKDKAHATQVAVDHGLLTQFTNLILVAEREARLEGFQELRRVTHMVAAGWHGVGSMSADIAYDAMPVFSLMASANLSGSENRNTMFERVSAQAKTPPKARSILQRFFSPGGKAGWDRDGDRPTPADRFIRAFTEELGDLEAVNLEWLQSAGLSDDLCKALAAFVKGTMTSRDVAIVALYLIVTEAKDDRFPREQGRLVRNAFLQIRERGDTDIDDLIHAIKAVTKGRTSWASAVRGDLG